MYALVLFVYRNKVATKLQLEDGRIVEIAKRFKHIRKGDICLVYERKSEPCLKPLTSEDDIVIVNKAERKRLVPYGYFGPFDKPPSPIATP